MSVYFKCVSCFFQWIRELKPFPENAFKKCFDDLINRWHKCIISGGAFFKVDKINLDE